MSELREAAQAALEQWDKASDVYSMSAAVDRLRAALAQPESGAEPVAWLHHAQVGDGGDGRTLSFSPDYYPSLASRGIGVVRKTIAVVPLYAHPPRDEWRPASDATTPPFVGMVVCPICGNKRCPHANNRDLACTNSNALGQTGSAYPTHLMDVPPPTTEGE